MPLFKQEFPDYDDELYCPDGWRDQSWHNDTCPHIQKRIDTLDTEIEVNVWQDYANEDKRETLGERYLFTIKANGFDIFSYFTNDLGKVKELMDNVDF